MTSLRPPRVMGGGPLTLLGLVAGGFAGGLLAAWPPWAEVVVAVCMPVGRVWLSALQMTVLPLVVSVLIIGVADVASVAQAGRVARHALAWMISLSLFSSILGVMLARLAFSCLPQSPSLTTALAAAGGSEAVATPATSWLTLIPSNVVAAAAAGGIAPVVVFTLAFAVSLSQLDPARRAPVIELARSLAAAMTVLIGWILAAAPIGVFALAVPLASAGGGHAIGLLGSYVAVLIGVYAAIVVCMYGVAWLSGCGLRRFLVTSLAPQGVAAGTQSSLASLPAMLRASDELGLAPSVSGLVLPLAVSLFRVMSPVQYLVVAEFIAWSRGVEIGLPSLLMLVPLAVVISLGSVGLPGQASFMGTTLPLVQAAGLPVEPLGLLMAVDVIPDVAATVGNVTADLALTASVAMPKR